MVKDIYGKICRGEEIRANLIRLKEAIRDEAQKRAFVYLLAGDFSELAVLLKHEDAKVRKNAALILGELECEDVLPKLFAAYSLEKQLFVKADYLRAMEKLDCQEYLAQLKDRRKRLVCELETAEEENKKHLRKESAVLTRLLLKYEKPKRHTFRGDRADDVILICNRLHREVTARQITQGKVTLLAGGVRIQDADLEELAGIRTWQELLFPLHGVPNRRAEPEAAAKSVLCSDMMDLLEKYHTGGGPFWFRLDYRGTMEAEKKGAFLKKTAAILEEGSRGRLKNSTSDYEIEIRLVESKKGGYLPMLVLHTMEDCRFAYRREHIAASITPVNAALIMELAGKWLKENVQVLDPCCGVGTMLIERNYYRSADPLYGVDLFAEGIEKARQNSQRAKMPIHYINRDFFAFHHTYLFDELITDLPADADESFYRTFFAKTEELLRDGGIVVLYNRSGDLLERMCRQWESIEILKTAVLNERQNSLVVIGRYRKKK